MSLKQAAELALEALKTLYLTLSPESVLAISLNHRITDLCAALAEPEQEPVAWVYTSHLAGNQTYITRYASDLTTYKADKVTPLYTSPPARESSSSETMTCKPLTDEKIDALELPPSGTATVRDLVRLIEAAHGIKGEA